MIPKGQLFEHVEMAWFRELQWLCSHCCHSCHCSESNLDHIFFMGKSMSRISIKPIHRLKISSFDLPSLLMWTCKNNVYHYISIYTMNIDDFPLQICRFDTLLSTSSSWPFSVAPDQHLCFPSNITTFVNHFPVYHFCINILQLTIFSCTRSTSMFSK